MFALALHSRRENERRANEKRRATIAAGRLHQRASQISIDDTTPKSGTKVQSPTTPTADNQPDHDQGRKGAHGQRLVDSKGRSYSAITVIRTKAPEDILNAAGVSMPHEDPGQGGSKPKGEPNASSPSAVVIRESSPRVLVVRMTPDQHKKAAERLKRQLTQPNIQAHSTPDKSESGHKHAPLVKKLSK